MTGRVGLFFGGDLVAHELADFKLMIGDFPGTFPAATGVWCHRPLVAGPDFMKYRKKYQKRTVPNRPKYCT